MILLDDNATEIPNYKAYVMTGADMAPTVNEGDFVVIDLAQRFIRSGDIYVVEYQQSIIICRLLLDVDRLKLVFDGATHEFDENVNAIKVIGRAIEVKSTGKEPARPID